MKKLMRQALSAPLAAGLVISLASVAFASTRSDLGGLPNPRGDGQAPFIAPSTPPATAAAWLQGALSLRQSQLVALADAVGANKNLSSADLNALTQILSNAKQGIAALQAKPADLSVGAVRVDAASMVAFHVFAVVTPQVKLVLGADNQAAEAARLAKLEPGMAAALVTKHSSVTAVTLDHEFVTDVSVIATGLASLTASVLAISPANFPLARQQIDADSATASSLRGEITSAESILSQIVRALASPGLGASARVSGTAASHRQS